MLKETLTREEYTLKLALKCLVLQPLHENEPTTGQDTKYALTSRYNEEGGPKKQQQKDSITTETWRWIHLGEVNKSLENIKE